MPSEIELAQAYLESLLRTERALPADLEAYQGELLSALYAHAISNVPFYKSYPVLREPVGPKSSFWSDLPFVSRRDLAERCSALRTEHVPSTHGVAMPVQSGGSTGRPVQIALSALESVARIVTTTACSLHGRWMYRGRFS